MPEVATPNQAEREFETWTDESFKNTSATAGAAHSENQRVTYANIKRTYDVYQDLDIQAARQALVAQGLNASIDLLPGRGKFWAMVGLSAVQGVVGVLAHFVNPDGTPAEAPYIKK
jgi:hypothetical protein